MIGSSPSLVSEWPRQNSAARAYRRRTYPAVLRPEYADPRILALPLECGVNVIALIAAPEVGSLIPNIFTSLSA